MTVHEITENAWAHVNVPSLKLQLASFWIKSESGFVNVYLMQKHLQCNKGVAK